MIKKKFLRPKVFIGLIDIASYYSSLKRGFDDIGVQSVFVALESNKFSRESTLESKYLTLRMVYYVIDICSKKSENHILKKCYLLILFPALKAILLLWAAIRFDVFIFGFGQTFFNYKELPFLRALGKKVFHVFNGSDSRPPYLSGKYIHPDYKINIASCFEQSKKKKITVHSIENNSDICINHPPQAHFHEKKFINYCFIGFPCQLEDIPNEQSITSSLNVVRIVHAPTAPGPKGTLDIRELISRLVGEGLNINYIELINKPNKEVIDELKICDFVIDELYSDIPLAGLATEAAFFGKPAVVAGYAQDEIREYASKAGIPMELYVKPEDIELTVRKLITDAKWREECGRIAKSFVCAHWNPAQVAGRFLRLIRGDIPAEWWHDPQSIQYEFGWGVSEDQAKKFLMRYIQFTGTDGLLLSDKPKLQSRILEFSKNNLNESH